MAHCCGSNNGNSGDSSCLCKVCRWSAHSHTALFSLLPATSFLTGQGYPQAERGCKEAVGGWQGVCHPQGQQLQDVLEDEYLWLPNVPACLREVPAPSPWCCHCGGECLYILSLLGLPLPPPPCREELLALIYIVTLNEGLVSVAPERKLSKRGKNRCYCDYGNKIVW